VKAFEKEKKEVSALGRVSFGESLFSPTKGHFFLPKGFHQGFFYLIFLDS
jgi:hypothetical protein